MSNHERNDLLKTIKESGPDRFQAVFSQWASMHRYDPNSKDFSRIQTLSDPKRTPEIEKFLGAVRANVKKELDSGDYESAINVLTQAFKESSEQFSGDFITTVQRFLWFRAGHVHEHRATYGDLSKKPYGDTDRTASYLIAATCYMQADIALGYVSDYAVRVSESLRGAGPLYGSFAGNATRKFSGQDVVIIGPDDPAGQVIALDLVRRSKDTREGLVPGGGDVNLISNKDLPPDKSN